MSCSNSEAGSDAWDIPIPMRENTAVGDTFANDETSVQNNELPAVVIADDNREILKRLAKLLPPSYRIVSQAEDGDTALKAIQAHQPRLAILDISMPTMNGLEVARQLRANHSSTKVVFLTLQNSSIGLIDEARRCANGFVTKMRLYRDLLPALDAALRGEFFLRE